MSNIKLNCCICGKELGLGNRVSSDGVLWRCEDCARKQREEYDNKDKTIADLETKLAEKEKELHYKNCECEKWKRDYENCSRLEKTISKERQYCLDNWRASEQNKISFCIEKLEQVKKYAQHIQGGLINYIDNQIEELKKENNNG